MGYRKELETKVIRSVHVIDIFECCSGAKNIKDSINRVPDNAKLISVEEDGNETGKYYLKFEEEIVDGKNE